MADCYTDMTPEQFREKLAADSSFKEKVVQYLEKLIKLDFEFRSRGQYLADTMLRNQKRTSCLRFSEGTVAEGTD